jgi:uncharacterized protein (DUF885 family)
MRPALFVLLAAMLVSPGFSQTQPANNNWISTSNEFTSMLLKVEMKHNPEAGSRQGLSEYDELISQPTLADENQERKEAEEVVVKLKAALPQQKQKEVAQDLEIIIRRAELNFRMQDYQRAHNVPFTNASGLVFAGIRMLLDEQTPAERRAAAVVRLRRYAGMEAEYKPITEILQQRVVEQTAKPGILYPAKVEIETELGRNSHYVDGIADLCKEYKLNGWEEPYAKLKTQLADFDAWIRANVLPKARADFRLLAEEYALSLELFGIDIPPAQMAELAHKGFAEIQAEMKPIAAQIAKQRKLASSDYRDVIRELKKEQLVGDKILPFYQSRLKQVEEIITKQQLVTLPERPARIRIASAAETAQQPAPHMVPPPFLHNTGEKGEFVLPLNIPAGAGQSSSQKYDDFTFDAAAWTLIAHEARPGHELQFDSMVEHGVSVARVRYAFNSTNVEGWGLYSESIVKPFMPLEGQLISLDYRLLRAARAFLDPELQAGKITPEGARQILENDVVQSPAFAQEEVERYTYRAPGQANSYYYGYTKLIALRKDTVAVMGGKFDQKKFHDFILAQGLLPPDLLRQAVMTEFVGQRRAGAQ